MFVDFHLMFVDFRRFSLMFVDFRADLLQFSQIFVNFRIHTKKDPSSLYATVKGSRGEAVLNKSPHPPKIRPPF